MCNESRAECCGWGRSCTRTEALLTILEAILLTFCCVFLTFLILHFIYCYDAETSLVSIYFGNDSTTEPFEREESYTVMPTTALSERECTWTPSEKTAAGTRYFERNETVTRTPLPPPPDDGKLLPSVDGVLADEPYILALVKVEGTDVTFGCILTIISNFWTLTAASCIESVEKLHELDSFAMMEDYGVGGGGTHAVSEVVAHPRYQRATGAFDVAALKSEDKLSSARDTLPRVPTAIDYLSIAIGERLALLGFGKFRNTGGPPSGPLRAVSVHVLPRAACGRAGGGAAVCAGAGERTRSCGYCAGAPLVQANVLLGVRSARACGETCAPVLYESLATVADWLTALMEE